MEYSYDHCVETEAVMASEADRLIDFSNDEKASTKSRYIPISHANAISYIMRYPDQKVILVGTSCAVSGLLNVIEKKKLNRDNYLIIGLFCESMMNYHIWDYFKQNKFTKSKGLLALHFKNKESGGWPGNMKLFFADGSHRYLDKSFRIETKEYYKLERCMYCIDKLNVRADISLGDNYTGVDSSLQGSNTVLIRTERGVKAWQRINNALEYNLVDRDRVIRAQLLKERKTNLDYAFEKGKKIEELNGIKLDINGFGIIGTEPNKNDYKSQLSIISQSQHLSYINGNLLLSHTKAKTIRILKRLLRHK